MNQTQKTGQQNSDGKKNNLSELYKIWNTGGVGAVEAKLAEMRKK